MQSPGTRRTLHLAVATLLVAAAACGGDDSTAPEPVSATATPDTGTPETGTPDTGTPDTSTPGTIAPAPAAPVIDELRVGLAANLALAAGYAGIETDERLAALVGDVSYEAVQDPDGFRSNLASGRFDVALLPVNIAANLANREIDVRLVGVVEARLLSLVAPADTVGTAGWGALRGQTVHLFFPGDVADLIFQQTAAAHGLQAGVDYTIAYHQAIPDLAAAVATGTAAYAVVPQPMATIAVGQAAAAGHDVAVALDLGAEWEAATGASAYPGIGVVVSGRLADDHPDVVDALAERIATNVAAVAADPAAHADRLGEITGVPGAVAGSVLGQLELGYADATPARPAIEAFLQAILDVAPDAVGGHLPPDRFYAR